jgi:hypothetical protein
LTTARKQANDRQANRIPGHTMKFSTTDLFVATGSVAILIGGMLFIKAGTSGPDVVRFVNQSIIRHYKELDGGDLAGALLSDVLDYMLGRRLEEFPGWTEMGEVVLDSGEVPEWREQAFIESFLDRTSFQPGRDKAWLFKTHPFRIPNLMDEEFSTKVWSFSYTHALVIVESDGVVVRYQFISNFNY